MRRLIEALIVSRWAWTESRRLLPRVRRDGIDALDAVAPAPRVDDLHRRVVAVVLRLTRATCLVRTAMLQRWDADHGRPRPLVIGVARDGVDVVAHAWLDGEVDAARYTEMHRRAAPNSG